VLNNVKHVIGGISLKLSLLHESKNANYFDCSDGSCAIGANIGSGFHD